ncbi:MAG: endonuclease V [Deltaproteobacteria bacterium]|nr:endonuclease V [Deltaproteobacteria bacterium]
MIAFVDVHYSEEAVSAAILAIESWSDEEILVEKCEVFLEPASKYESGSFYQRELPAILRIVEDLPQLPNTIVIDGYIMLSSEKKGLGMHLFKALGSNTTIIGVAKNPFKGAESVSIPVCRGNSHRPLHVTVVGIDISDAARNISEMSGIYRIPFLLKRVDHLARSGLISR